MHHARGITLLRKYSLFIACRKWSLDVRGCLMLEATWRPDESAASIERAPTIYKKACESLCSSVCVGRGSPAASLSTKQQSPGGLVKLALDMLDSQVHRAICKNSTGACARVYQLYQSSHADWSSPGLDGTAVNIDCTSVEDLHATSRRIYLALTKYLVCRLSFWRILHYPSIASQHLELRSTRRRRHNGMQTLRAA
jgi:hypothetical protein